MALKINERPWANIADEDQPFSSSFVVKRNNSINRRKRESEE
jgi:hypothetical protein